MRHKAIPDNVLQYQTLPPSSTDPSKLALYPLTLSFNDLVTISGVSSAAVPLTLNIDIKTRPQNNRVARMGWII